MKKDLASFVPVRYGYCGCRCCPDRLRRQLHRCFFASSTATSCNGIHRSRGSAAAKPDGYPNASMTLVVGFGAGGDTDLNNRLMAQYVEPSFGQSIAVTNMAGSNSSVALTQYQSTPTDGYTILGTNSAALSSTTTLPAPASTATKTLRSLQSWAVPPAICCLPTRLPVSPPWKTCWRSPRPTPTPSRWACPPAATPTSTLSCCSRPASRATSLTAAMVPIVSQLWWAATWMSASCRT